MTLKFLLVTDAKVPLALQPFCACGRGESTLRKSLEVLNIPPLKNIMIPPPALSYLMEFMLLFCFDGEVKMQKVKVQD